jgi:hypothetical protein
MEKFTVMSRVVIFYSYILSILILSIKTPKIIRYLIFIIKQQLHILNRIHDPLDLLEQEVLKIFIIFFIGHST